MPSLIVRAGGKAEKRVVEFFAAQIRNRNTREAYLCAVRDFLGWAEDEARIGDLLDIEPVHVAAWVELKSRSLRGCGSARPCPDRAHDLHLRAGLGCREHEREGRVPKAENALGAVA
jgi:hypothetical protein